MKTTVEKAPTGSFAGGIEDYGRSSERHVTRALSLRADYIRTSYDTLGGEVHDLHGEVRELDLNERSFLKGKQDVPALLDELAYARGLSWANIAELASVSVSAVRKWRKGGEASADNRSRLARLAALLDVLQEKALVQDPARWMEMELPLAPGMHVRPLDLYIDGQELALLDIAEQRKPMAQVLDEARPGWRETGTDFEVFTDTDGQRSIRIRTE